MDFQAIGTGFLWLTIIAAVYLTMLVLAPLFIWSHLAEVNKKLERLLELQKNAAPVADARTIRRVFHCPDCNAELRPPTAGIEFKCHACGASLTASEK